MKRSIAAKDRMMIRRDQMDGLRAICFLSVFAYHANTESFPWGYAGVSVFFALSGFLITGLLGKMQATASDLSRFYVRRFIRLCPLYYAYLTLIAIAGERNLGWYWLNAGNLAITLDRGWPSAPVGHFWTLAVEFQFYLLFPLMFLWTPQRFRIGLIVGLLVASKLSRVVTLAVLPMPWGLHLLPACSEYLLWGCLISLIRSPSSEQQCLWLFCGGAAVFCGWVWFFEAAGGYHTANERLRLLASIAGTPDGIGAALAVHGLWWSRGLLAKALSREPLAYLGRISYGLYVLHIIALRWSAFLGREVPGVWRIHWELALLFTIGLAGLSWRYFERPIARLGRPETVHTQIVAAQLGGL